MNELFTKEDIEKYGFVYEPDESKCKITKTGPHYDCNYYKDGQFTGKIDHEIDDEWKSGTAEVVKARMPNWKYIHSVFVPDISPLSGKGVLCRWVMIKGHS